MGQLGQVAFEVVTAELDQGRAHPVVQLPPFPGRQLPVQRLADQGVREPEPARPAGHQPGVHGLLQGVEDLVGWQAGDAGDHVEVEVAALDRRRGQAGVGGVREPPRRSVG